MAHRVGLAERPYGDIELLVIHCDMLEAAFAREGGDLLGAGPFESPEHEVLLNGFTTLHLLTSMYLVDARNQATGGLCSAVLKEHRALHLLDEIRDIMRRGVGRTTVGDFLRRSRNKLATHGDFSLSTLPLKEREVVFSLDYAEELREALGHIPGATRRLRKACAGLMQ